MTSKKPARATLGDLLNKPPRTKEVRIKSGDAEVTILFKTVGSRQYDDLVADHKPTKEQTKENYQWNPETFPAALISACSVEPEITHEEAEQLWNSPDWSRGELMDVFMALIKLNSDGLDVPFSESV